MVCMTKLEYILQEAESLTPIERSELIARLAESSAEDGDAEEIGAGLRGLAAWTESGNGENWEQFYPDSLRRNRRSPA